MIKGQLYYWLGRSAYAVSEALLAIGLKMVSASNNTSLKGDRYLRRAIHATTIGR